MRRAGRFFYFTQKRARFNLFLINLQNIFPTRTFANLFTFVLYCINVYLKNSRVMFSKYFYINTEPSTEKTYLCLPRVFLYLTALCLRFPPQLDPSETAPPPSDLYLPERPL